MPSDEPNQTPVEISSRRRKSKGVPAEELHGRYPSLTALTNPSAGASRYAWLAVFRARPNVMHALLADFIKQVHAQPGRVGQRPMPKEHEVDLASLVYGEETNDPIAKVLPGLMKVGERPFAQRTFMSRTQLQRLLRGEYDPDVNEIRLIAAAVKKPPTYFVEYRKAMAISAFINLLEERPGIASALYRQYLEVRMGDSR